MDFLPAKELKNDFVVVGNFYDLEIEPGKVIPCRNVLEIYTKEHYRTLNHDGSLFFGIPDALFIMMNPGSSKPRQKRFVPPVLSEADLSNQLLKQQIVTTKPDTTQYQLMRLMQVINWDHVRILNLSDIRQPKSSKFLKQVKQMDNPIHSIFAPERSIELGCAMRNLKPKAPTVCAWGVNEKLRDLSMLCLQSIPSDRIVGVYYAEGFYRHPLPSLIQNKIEWLDNITECLKKREV